MHLRLILILLILCQSLAAQKPVILSDYVQEVVISDMELLFMHDPGCSTQPPDLFKGRLDQHFRSVDFSDPDPALNLGLWLLLHPDLKRTARVLAFRDHMEQAIIEKRNLFEGLNN